MRRIATVGCVLAASFATSTSSPAQRPLAPPEPAIVGGAASSTSLHQTSASLQLLDGTLWGVGVRYKVRFLDHGFEFVPALGERAPHNQPVRFDLQSVGRGAETIAVSRSFRHHEGQLVEYRRNEVLERYDVRLEGIAQSFVFDRLPLGTGDLVVRGTLATELVVTPDGDGLRLELDGVGGLRIGGVTGIDARGNRAAGAIRYENGLLELSLPAAFVDQAALPLVLDPLVGSVFNAFTLNEDDRDPDVAYDVSNNVYLVVFERRYSAADYDVHGQFVNPDGSLNGGRIYIENGISSEFDPAVANVNLRDYFVVVYTRSGDVKARGVDAATGSVTAEIDVAVGSDSQIHPDIGGEATTFDDDAICVWWNETDDAIRAIQIEVSATGSLSTHDFTTIQVSTIVPPSRPRISKGGGETGHHMIVYEREDSTTDRDPMFSIVDRELTLLRGVASCTGAVDDQQRPDVDGDGRQWVVAWQTQEAVTGKDDIACRAVRWDPLASPGFQSAFSSPVTTVTADANDWEFDAKVVMTGGSALVGWSDEDGPFAFAIYFKSLDPFTCTPCENVGQYIFSGPFSWDINLELCCQRSGGGSSDRTLLVMETYDSGGTNTSNIVAQRWGSADGATFDFGGGCSEGGLAYATCARAGNSGFAARMLSEVGGAPAWLVVSRDFMGLPCGSCRLIPDPYTGFVVTTTTDASGVAEFAVAIPGGPAVLGVTLYMQWLVFEPTTPGCIQFGSDMTNGMRLTIE